MPCKGNKGFPECKSCLNREFDPFQCETCNEGSNYEPEDTEEEMSYDDFLTEYRSAFE